MDLWLLTAYEISLNFFQYFRIYRQNDISSAFSLAVVTSYHLHLHIKMAAYISEVLPLWMQISWEPEVIMKNGQRCFFPILSDLTSETNMFFGWTFPLNFKENFEHHPKDFHKNSPQIPKFRYDISKQIPKLQKRTHKLIPKDFQTMIPNVSQINSKPSIFPNSGKGLVLILSPENQFSTIVPNFFQINPTFFTNFGRNLFFPVKNIWVNDL